MQKGRSDLGKGGGKRTLLGGLLAMFLLVGVVGWPDCSPAVDGTRKWAYTTGGYVSSSPAIGADGTIYIGSRDGKLYAINPNGTLQWAYTTGGYVSSSPAIASKGVTGSGLALSQFPLFKLPGLGDTPATSAFPRDGPARILKRVLGARTTKPRTTQSIHLIGVAGTLSVSGVASPALR